MPSKINVVAFRPDPDEERLLHQLARKTGLPKTRILGQALREKAEREGFPVVIDDEVQKKAVTA
jgi:predicted transcriptional regulator